jgi:circadian clock protein KaiB
MNRPGSFSFRLYITGNAPNSERALANLSAMCNRHLPDRHRIEVVDLLRDPQRALSDRVFLTPTLVKLSPGPELRIVGSLSDTAPILASLGLSTA